MIYLYQLDLIKTKVYKTMVGPVLVYEADTWAIKEEHGKRLEVAETICLRATTGVTRRERIKKHGYKTGIEGTVLDLREKIRESRLRWNEHVKIVEGKKLVRWVMKRKKPRNKEQRPTKKTMD